MRRSWLVCLLPLFLAVTGCVRSSATGIRRVWADFNTLNAPAIYWERQEHLPAKSHRVDHLRWMYGRPAGLHGTRLRPVWYSRPPMGPTQPITEPVQTPEVPQPEPNAVPPAEMDDRPPLLPPLPDSGSAAENPLDDAPALAPSPGVPPAPEPAWNGPTAGGKLKSGLNTLRRLSWHLHRQLRRPIVVPAFLQRSNDPPRR